MADVKLVRLDFRLIHGQVITKWFAQALANRIVIIDDELATDDFMKSIYEMAAPPGAKVKVYTVEKAIKRWNKDEMGDGKLLILFKNVDTAYTAFKGGLPLKELQIGGLGSAPNRKVVYGPITLDDHDAKLLNEMDCAGVHVYLHQVPEESPMDFSTVMKKFDFNID